MEGTVTERADSIEAYLVPTEVEDSKVVVSCESVEDKLCCFWAKFCPVKIEFG